MSRANRFLFASFSFVLLGALATGVASQPIHRLIPLLARSVLEEEARVDSICSPTRRFSKTWPSVTPKKNRSRRLSTTSARR